MFCTKHSIGRTSNIHERCLRLIQKTTPLILKYFYSMQMKKQLTKNACNFLRLRIMNT